jgi:hypothetical protein
MNGETLTATITPPTENIQPEPQIARPPQPLSAESEITPNLLERVCLQCGYNFLQEVTEMLRCLCPECRSHLCSPTEEVFPVVQIPIFVSSMQALEEFERTGKIEEESEEENETQSSNSSQVSAENPLP